jgi:hypothetical protein
MVVADCMTGHVLVGPLRMRVICRVDLVDIEHLAGMDGAIAAGVSNHRHDNYAEKQPNQKEQ